MHYEEFLDAFRELYGQRPLTEGQFVGIVRQLQERQPLINYMETTVYEDIYRQLSRTEEVTLDRAIELTNYLIYNNRQAIGKDIEFYMGLVEKLEENGQSHIDSAKLTQLLRAKSDLNECLLKCMLDCFAGVQGISVRKFRSLIEQLKMEIIGEGSISFVREFDVARSMWADTSKIYHMPETQNSPELKQEPSLEDLTKDFFRKLSSLFDYIDYECTDTSLQKKADAARKRQAEFSEFYENERTDFENELQYMRAGRKQLQQQLYQERAQRELLAGHTEKLEAQLEKLKNRTEEDKQDRLELARTIRQLNHDLNTKKAEYAEIKSQLKSVHQEKEEFRSAINDIVRSARQVESDNQRLKTLLQRQSQQEEEMLADRTLRGQLDDANTKIALLEEQLDEERARIDQYQRDIEQYQFQMDDMQMQLASKIHLQPPPLRQEGVRQSYFTPSRVEFPMKSRIDPTRQSTAEVYNLDSSSVKPFRQSVMMKSKIKASQLQLPNESILAFQQNSRVNEIIDNNRSSLAVRLDLSQVPFTPPRQEDPSPNPSPPSKFAKKVQVPQITINLIDQIYQHDYADVREQENIKELIERDKNDCDFSELFLDKRFRFFSCGAKLVLSDATIDKVVVVVTCTNLYLMKVGKGKWQKKDPVRLIDIRKLLLGDHSYLMAIRFGGENDYLLLTNRRRQLAYFLLESRGYITQEGPLQIEKYLRNRDIVVTERKKEVELSNFKMLFTPYTVGFQYYQFCSEVSLEHSKLLGGSYFKSVFLVVNYAGLHFFESDELQTKHDFKEKLIMYLPILPNLNLVEYGEKNDKLVRLKYEDGILQTYKVQCRSASEKEDLVMQVRSIRAIMLQRKEEQQRQDKMLLQYRQID